MKQKSNKESIYGTRLAVINHVQQSEEELKVLYPKMKLREEMLESCEKLGRELTK